MHVETFNISFESTQNMQHFGTKVSDIEGRQNKLWNYKFVANFYCFDLIVPPRDILHFLFILPTNMMSYIVDICNLSSC